MKTKVVITAAAVVGFAASALAWSHGWSWECPGDIMKQVDFTLRPEINRAIRTTADAMESERRGERPDNLVRKFRGASAEWRKVQIQAENSDVAEDLVAYTLFMQGYTKMKARDSNEAIKIYDQVVDIYDELPRFSFAARYFNAQIKFGMGDSKVAWRMMDDLSGDEAAARHPLMASVLNSCAWHKWGAFKEAEAQELWSRGSDKVFAEIARDAYDSCRSGLHLACIVRADFEALADYVFDGVKENDHRRRCDILRDEANWVIGNLNNGDTQLRRYFGGKYKKDSDRESQLKKFRTRFTSWFDLYHSEFVEAHREFECSVLGIRLRYGVESKLELCKRIDKLMGTIDGMKDEGAVDGSYATVIGLYGDIGDRDKQLAALARYANTVPRLEKAGAGAMEARIRKIVDYYYTFGEYDYAMMLVDKLKGNPLGAAWLRYEICHHAAFRGKRPWKDCIPHLQEYLNHHPDVNGHLRANYAMARIYRDRMGQPREALKIFLSIDDAPTSLWELVWTYRALKEMTNCENSLKTIASLFKDQAPRAVWTLADYMEKDGNKKRAIGLYRNLLSQPEWKTCQESSWAHQALERLGVATGGAMINEVH